MLVLLSSLTKKELELLHSGMLREINGLKSQLRKVKAKKDMKMVDLLEEKVVVAKQLRRKIVNLKDKGI